jgi:hypothetical protein
VGFEDLVFVLTENENTIQEFVLTENENTIQTTDSMTFQGMTTTSILGNYDSALHLLQWSSATDEVLDEFSGKTNDAIAIAKITEPTQIGTMSIGYKNTYTPVGYPMIMVTGGQLAGPVKCDTIENALIHAAAERISYCVPLEVATNDNNDDIVNEHAIDLFDVEGASLPRLIRNLISDGQTPEVTMNTAKASDIKNWRAKGDPDQTTWNAYKFTGAPLEAIDNTWQVAYESNERAALVEKFGIPAVSGLQADQALAITLNNEFVQMAEQLVNTQIELARTFKRVTQTPLTSEQITPSTLSVQQATVMPALTVPASTGIPSTSPSFTTPTGTGPSAAASAAASGFTAGYMMAPSYPATATATTTTPSPTSATAPSPSSPGESSATVPLPTSTTSSPGGTGY